MHVFNNNWGITYYYACACVLGVSVRVPGLLMLSIDCDLSIANSRAS